MSKNRKPKKMMVAVSRISTAFADAVRDGIRREDVIEDYLDALRTGEEMPPVDLFVGPDMAGPFHAGDGGYRIASHRLFDPSNDAKISATVHFFPTDQEAKQAALLCAAKANETHGVRRSRQEKKLAVATILLRPEYATLADCEVGRMCKATHTFVKRIRGELGDALPVGARFSDRDYKPGAVYGSGRIINADGTTTPVVTTNGVHRDNSKKPRKAHAPHGADVYFNGPNPPKLKKTSKGWKISYQGDVQMYPFPEKNEE